MFPKKQKYQHLIAQVLVGTCLSLFFLLLYDFHPPFLEKLSNRVHDYKFELREKVWPSQHQNNRTVIVAIDEPSINQYGRWPWDRKIIANLLSKLNQSSIIGLDMIFSEPSNAESDNYLAETIANNGNIVLGYFLRTSSSVDNTIADQDILEECAYHNFSTKVEIIGLKEVPYAELNLKPFHNNASSCAFFSIEPDKDGLYRKYPLAYIHNGLVLPPLAVQMMRILFNDEAKLILNETGIEKFELANVTLSNTNYLRVNYTKNIKMISAADVLSGKLNPEIFKDKIIFVGVTETGVFDIRPTPISPITPGVQIHYAVLNNLLDDNVLLDTRNGDSVLILIAILITSYIATFASIKRRFIFYIFMAIFVFCYSNIVLYIFNVWHQEFFALLAIFLTAVLNETYTFRRADKRATELRQAFSSYVSSDLVNQIIENPSKLQLGGDEKEITILFSDIRNFTNISEKLSPTKLVESLNKLFSPLTSIVLKNQGMLDKYIGDAMMVIFNAPLDVENHPEKAVETALSMILAMDKINKELSLDEDVPNMEIGVGINTGNAVIGNMGSAVRFDYTAMGDAVNIASRLEGLNKLYQSNIIISEATKNQLDHGKFLIRKLDKIQVKGKESVFTIYEVLLSTEKNREKVDLFEEALSQFYLQNFLVASKQFQSISDEYEDYPSLLFHKRCIDLISNRPNSDWTGVWKMMRK